MQIVRATFLICLFMTAMLCSGTPAFPESDVTDAFQFDRDRPYYDYTHGQTCTTASLTNISSQSFQGTLRLVIDDVTCPQVTPFEPDGVTGDGKPYFDLSLPWNDFDGNGTVDGNDIAVLTGDLGRTDCFQGPPCKGDLNGDGDVDGGDLALYQADLGQSDDNIQKQFS